MKRTLRQDQSGMVAIIITMIMMFVITLIVLGFSESTRRNQREALDTQLGQQAYYAAETGVNDITNAIKSGVALTSHTDCSSFNLGTLTLPRLLKADGSVANTCLMVEPEPFSLVADDIPATSGSVMWYVKNASPQNFTKLTVGWSPDSALTNPLNTCSSVFKTYPSAPNWKCDRALLRVDILPASVPSTDADTLAAMTTTLYLQPVSGSKYDPNISAFGNPAAWQGACTISTPTPMNQGCSVNIDLSGGAQARDYYVRISALYVDAKSVTLQGFSASGATKFTEGQIVVDSTGRAQDQIKRIKVRIPLTKTDTTLPVYAVQSAGSTCKATMFNTAGAGHSTQGICELFLAP